MDEYLLSVVSYENIGQKTRIILPMTHSRTRFQHQPEIDVKKKDSVYRGIVPDSRT